MADPSQIGYLPLGGVNEGRNVLIRSLNLLRTVLLPLPSLRNCSIADHDNICGKAAISIWMSNGRYPVSYFQIG